MLENCLACVFKFLLLLLFITTLTITKSNAVKEKYLLKDINQDFLDLMESEKKIIDYLGAYINNLEEKIHTIKRNTVPIQKIYYNVVDDVDAYLNNPLNALSIIKRFVTDWPNIVDIVNATNNMTTVWANDNLKDLDLVELPSESDYDEAIHNLLRLQDFYELKESFAFNEINGMKLSSEMSWSDCLEVGRMSSKLGDYSIAKFWIESALKSINQTEMTAKNAEYEGARLMILNVLLNTEYKAGQMDKALEIVEQLLETQPTNKNLQKAKNNLIRKLKTQKYELKPEIVENKQSLESKAEKRIIQDLCRATTNKVNNNHMDMDNKGKNCFILYSKLLYTIPIEVINIEPYIFVQHNVLDAHETDYVHNQLSTNQSDAEYLIFEEKTQKKILYNLKLSLGGHYIEILPSWHIDYYTHTDETTSEDNRNSKISGYIMLGLQVAKLGGAIVFPQLELSVDLSKNSLLYWSNINEFKEVDYRTKYQICPVIVGLQINALNTFK